MSLSLRHVLIIGWWQAWSGKDGQGSTWYLGVAKFKGGSSESIYTGISYGRWFKTNVVMLLAQLFFISWGLWNIVKSQIKDISERNCILYNSVQIYNYCFDSASDSLSTISLSCLSLESETDMGPGNLMDWPQWWQKLPPSRCCMMGVDTVQPEFGSWMMGSCSGCVLSAFCWARFLE